MVGTNTGQIRVRCDDTAVVAIHCRVAAPQAKILALSGSQMAAIKQKLAR